MISLLADFLRISSIMLEFRREQLYLLHLLLYQVAQNGDGVIDALEVRRLANNRASEASSVRRVHLHIHLVLL